MPESNLKKEIERQLADLRQRSPALDEKIREHIEQGSSNLAKIVLTIQEDELCLKNAFEISGLNPNNVVHWKLLISLITAVLFAPPGRAGARYFGHVSGRF